MEYQCSYWAGYLTAAQINAVLKNHVENNGATTVGKLVQTRQNVTLKVIQQIIPQINTTIVSTNMRATIIKPFAIHTALYLTVKGFFYAPKMTLLDA